MTGSDGPRHIAVVGGSLAGLRAAEALRREGYDGRLTVVGDEPHQPYDRPPLSKQILAGDWPDEKVALRRDPDAEYDFRPGTKATGLDLRNGEVVLEGDERLAVDGVVVATGAAVRTLPGTPNLDGIHVLRTLDDCLALRAAFASRPHVVVIGAGFIGSEVASTARKLGLDVTVLEALPVPLERAIGADMGAVCAGLHTANGTDLRLSAGVSGFLGTHRVEGVELTDGTIIEAELVVVGVGVAPNTGWLEGSGLTVSNGVVCDDRCRALGGDGRVVAAGDVARWHNPLFSTDMRLEHWTNAVEMGAAAAAALLHGDAAPAYAPVPYFWSDQYGTKIQYIGHASPTDPVRVVEGSVEDGKFVAAYEQGGRMVAALMLKWPAKMAAYQQLIAEGAPVPSPK